MMRRSRPQSLSLAASIAFVLTRNTSTRSFGSRVISSVISPAFFTTGVQAFSSSTSSSPAAGLPNSHRIFVGNLSPDSCIVPKLTETFGQFGAVSDVSLHGLWKRSADGAIEDSTDDKKKKRKSKVRPYAFVTFEDADSASQAVNQWSLLSQPDTLYSGCVVKAAVPMKPRHKSNARKSRAQKRKELVAYLAKEANVVLQCPKSHLARLGDYLSSSLMYDCQVQGNLDAGRRTVGLLFVKADDPAMLADRLLNVPYAAIAVNKFYVVDGGAVRGKKIRSVAKEALDRIASLRDEKDDGSSIVVRIQAFPPKIRSVLISTMDAMWDENMLEGVDTSPTDFTHTLSVVQVEEDLKEDDDNCTYLVGLTPAMQTDAMSTHDRARFHEESIGSGGEDAVSRAYYKIQEVLTRYNDGSSNGSEAVSLNIRNRLAGSVAVDCGAAPGGWTKYILEESGCRTVHSIDPGELSPSVANMEGVNHMKMRVQDAIPRLAEDGVRIDLWASDACLHVMSEQLDWLLRAKDAGILSPNAMFVLTFKCNIGHSKGSYDSQVEREVVRLKDIATGIETMHLFSNRSGERTVMGFLL